MWIDAKTLVGSFQIPKNNLIMFNFSFYTASPRKKNSHHWRVKLAGNIIIFVNHRPTHDNNHNKRLHCGGKQKGNMFGSRLFAHC